MPELPEVETVVRRLQEVLPDKVFSEVSVFKDKSFSGDIAALQQTTITQVTRKSKIITFHLSSGDFLVTHLKMTGQLIYKEGSERVGGGHPTADWTDSLPSSHTRIHYTFTDGSELFFNDQRLFGWMRMFDQQQWDKHHAELGPDAHTDEATPEYLYQQLQRRTIPIKVAIMTNQIIAGAGNIYACDSLNLAKIDPHRPAKDLSKKEVAVLLDAIKTVLQRGIDLGGATYDGKYVSIDGMSGQYQEKILAYGREGELCYNCGTEIVKEKIRGRGTYYCPNCQR